MTDEGKDFLHRQLVKLGDMMGDGLHHEPDGRWISREYNRILKALGISAPRKNNGAMINEAMAKRIVAVECPQCGGKLKQIRAGSMRAICGCGAKFQLMAIRKVRKERS
jgi:hypothetical protein